MLQRGMTLRLALLVLLREKPKTLEQLSLETAALRVSPREMRSCLKMLVRLLEVSWLGGVEQPVKLSQAGRRVSESAWMFMETAPGQALAEMGTWKGETGS